MLIQDFTTAFTARCDGSQWSWLHLVEKQRGEDHELQPGKKEKCSWLFKKLELRDLAWRLQCCQSGWRASTMSGESSSIPIGISWSPIPQKTGKSWSWSCFYCYYLLTLFFWTWCFCGQVPLVLLQQRLFWQEGQEECEGHDAGDRHKGQAGR